MCVMYIHLEKFLFPDRRHMFLLSRSQLSSICIITIIAYFLDSIIAFGHYYHSDPSLSSYIDNSYRYPFNYYYYNYNYYPNYCCSSLSNNQLEYDYEQMKKKQQQQQQQQQSTPQPRRRLYWRTYNG